MFTSTIAFLNTPIFNYAAPRFIGSALLFVAGPTLTYQQQQMSATTTPLVQRRFKVLQLSLGITGIFALCGVPFTTTLPLALTYAIFLISSGMVSIAAKLKQDPYWLDINEAITPCLKCKGITRNMGYILVNPLEGSPKKSDYDWKNHPNEGCRLSYLRRTSAELPFHVLHKYPNLFPKNQEAAIIQIVGGGTFCVERPHKVLPKTLPQAVKIQHRDLDTSQTRYTGGTDVDLSFLIGKEIQDIDHLERLISEKYDGRYHNTHAVGAQLWRTYCEYFHHYDQTTPHPLDASIKITKKAEYSN